MSLKINNLVCISFVGTAYHGTQIQNNALTIQEVFQDALGKMISPCPEIKCCSRLDAGVHARKFYISFFTERSYPSDKIVFALNTYLPDDIRVLSHREVPEGFHARYSSGGKRYEYVIVNDRVMDPFLHDRAFLFHRRIDEAALNEVAKVFIGTYDFSSFCSIKSSVDDKVRTVFDAGVCREGHLVKIFFEADGYLYNMARIMAGALLQTVSGKLTQEDIKQYLGGKPRDNKLITVPAQGLYLTEVFYDFEQSDRD